MLECLQLRRGELRGNKETKHIHFRLPRLKERPGNVGIPLRPLAHSKDQLLKYRHFQMIYAHDGKLLDIIQKFGAKASADCIFRSKQRKGSAILNDTAKFFLPNVLFIQKAAVNQLERGLQRGIRGVNAVQGDIGIA